MRIPKQELSSNHDSSIWFSFFMVMVLAQGPALGVRRREGRSKRDSISFEFSFGASSAI